MTAMFSNGPDSSEKTAGRSPIGQVLDRIDIPMAWATVVGAVSSLVLKSTLPMLDRGLSPVESRLPEITAALSAGLALCAAVASYRLRAHRD